MLLSKIIQQIQSVRIAGSQDIEISGIRFDSREVDTGHLFVATRGTAADGHAFIPMAIQKGAVAVLCEEIPATADKRITYIQVTNSYDALGHVAAAWYGFPSSKLTLVGITGTNGKTTTATLLHRLFRQLGHNAGLLSTVRNFINDQAVEATHTTPDPMSLNALLAEMVNAGCTYVFMEVSSHAIEQRRIAGLEFDGAVFTNITRDHIDYHHTFDNYLKAKKRFFDELGNKAFALTNIDDKNGMVMLQNTKAEKHTYSIRAMADFKTKILEDGFEGMLLNMNGHEIHVPFIGRFNAYNLTAVYGAAVLLRQDRLETLRIISMLSSVPGRFETIRTPAGFTAIVDYAHTPDALENVIVAINEIMKGKGRLITIVGCGGNRDKGKRPMMARQASEGSWKAILTSDNPRNEDPADILNDMLAGLDAEQKSKSLTIADRREAIKTACAIAQSGDVVLVAGKGHEDYQIIKGIKYHFDDKEEVMKAAFGQ